MIIGTAGHIDHGKTTLVRALTGVDTDRLPEEKRRGISIELGYAYLPVVDGEPIGFVDVPGHERLLHTMLAGATGVDHALLLVAADDGVMPQTREHLAVLSLLGIRKGTIVITKIDRAPEDRVEEVRREAEALLAGSTLSAAPVFEVSAVSGAGMQALREHLLDRAVQCDRWQADESGFRLAVDRAFTLPGIGTIATGTVHAGSVRVGEELSLLPVAGGPARARVRGLHAQNVPVAVARSGHRCALQLAGVSKDSLERGQWLLTPAIGLVTDRLDARISLWHEEHTRLRCGTSVHLHHGTADVMARVVVLEGEAVEPGGQALVQLVLQRPVSAWRGDRLVLRDAAATRTLAGGTVLDPLSPARYRRTPQRLAWLAAAGEGDAVSRLGAVVDVSPHGLELATWRRTEGQLPSSLLATPKGAFVAGDWCVGQMQWQSMRGQVIAALERLHAQAPDELGPDAARLRRVALPRVAEGLWSVLLASLLANGELRREGAWLHRPEHGLRLSMEEQRVSRSLLPLMLAGGFDPPWVRDLAAATREPEPLVRATLARMGQRGEAFPIVRDLYYHARRVEELASLVRRLCERDGGVQAALFRDATGLGRKRAIQVLEFFDRIGLTRRVENEHRLRADTSLFDVE